MGMASSVSMYPLHIRQSGYHINDNYSHLQVNNKGYPYRKERSELIGGDSPSFTICCHFQVKEGLAKLYLVIELTAEEAPEYNPPVTYAAAL